MTSRFDRSGTNLIDLPSLVQNITSQRRDGVMTVRMGKEERFLTFTAGNLVALSGGAASTFAKSLVWAEVMSPDLVPLVSQYADILQVGARNMQNFALLNAVGMSTRPVLLKRGMMSTMEELLMAAEYILSNGNYNVILCERGIRTFETSTRFTMDLNAVPVLRHLTHLPIIVDPSHGVGIREYIPALAKAAVAVGADGLILEVHPKPEEALSDGPQSLLPDQFAKLMAELRAVALAVGRTI